MPYVAPNTVAAGETYGAAAHNVIVNDVIDHEARLLAQAPAAVVTSLPGSPTDGQVVYYVADGTNGVVWQLRYRSASTSSYKWEFVGGPQLISSVEANQNRANAAYGDLGTVGPSITVPLAGDYIINIGFTGNNGNAGQLARMSYAIGGSAAADADSVFYLTSVAAGNFATVTRPKLKTAIAANSAIVAKYRTDGVSVFFQDRFMEITPVRVG